VLDIPSTMQDTSDAITYRANDLNLDSSYAAMYTPDVKILDKFNDLELWVPPSGFVAAAYAHTDEVAQAWFAPAGMTRGSLNISEARKIYTLGHRDALTDSQINAIRYFPNGSGYKIWGADTMQTMASALSNVPVRRLMNMIEKAIGVADLYSVFDPNDQILRSKLKVMISEYLQPIRDAGGLYWYQVICDESNNPPSTIAAGMVVVDAYFDPVITTKRIKLTANILKTGATYREAVLDRTQV
jgi:phage tail sheath protein FI